MAPPAAPSRILIIEDEPGIAVALYTALIKAGYIGDVAKTGASGLRKASSKHYDLILLDLGLPDMSGLAICRQLRFNNCRSPIIILTAEVAIKSKVTLFDAGATDYVTKPFSIDELQARIRALLGSSESTKQQDAIKVGDMLLDPASRCVERDGLLIKLTAKEYAILEYLAQYPGVAVTRASLLQYVWNGEDAWTNTIDVHVKHLRDKVDRPFSHPMIHTVHGVGYKLMVPKVVAK